MKILTNIRFAQLAGIAQTLSSFVAFVGKDKNNRTKVVGVNVFDEKSKADYAPVAKEGNFVVRNIPLAMPYIAEVIKASENVQEISAAYNPVIEAYKKVISQEKPDLILINGTYYLPWCLYAASRYFSIPTVLHYHGILTKETEHWPEPQRKMFRDMERQFDSKQLFYIFPSNLTKTVVEKEVFGHRVSKFSVLPNPVPEHFFKVEPKRARKNIGVVGRWTRIKNPQFVKKFARYNQRKGSQFNIELVTDLKRNSKDREALRGLVRFRQPVENNKLGSLYGAMAVVLSPSYFETYGNVAQEALAAGIPALVSANMGVAETFESLGLGDWVVNFDSLKDVYDKAKEASQQVVPKDVRMAMKAKYSPEVLHKEMINILKAV